MSDFINNPDFDYNIKLARSLHVKQDGLNGVKNVTYNINNNKFSLQSSGEVF